jgi:hypothetical protein
MPKKLTVIIKTNKGFRKYRNIYARSFHKLVSYLQRENVECLWANFYDPDTKLQIGNWTKSTQTITLI